MSGDVVPSGDADPKMGRGGAVRFEEHQGLHRHARVCQRRQLEGREVVGPVDQPFRWEHRHVAALSSCILKRFRDLIFCSAQCTGTMSMMLSSAMLQ